MTNDARHATARLASVDVGRGFAIVGMILANASAGITWSFIRRQEVPDPA
jgi:uncharacterized membrane protein YeiB